MRRILVVTLLVICGLALAPGLQAQQTCSLQTLRGVYMSSCQGFQNISTNPAVPNLVPYASVAYSKADGRGNSSSSVIYNNIAGTLLAITPTGTYTVNEDCTGEFRYEDATLGKVVHKFVTKVDGSEAVSVNWTTGGSSPILCVFKRMGDRGME